MQKQGGKMKNKPNLKNYSTSVPESKSISEIEQILVKFGASAIFKEYNGDGSTKAISFQVKTEHGNMPFKIPMNDRAIAKYLSEQYERDSKCKEVESDLDTARRIGWRIFKDWIHAQLSIVQLKQVKVEEVFLPYAFNYETGKTFYETIESNKFKGLLLENKQN